MVWPVVSGRGMTRQGRQRKEIFMNWNLPIFDEMDLVYQSDEEVPEGREKISEEDFDAIREGLEDDE